MRIKKLVALAIAGGVAGVAIFAGPAIAKRANGLANGLNAPVAANGLK